MCSLHTCLDAYRKISQLRFVLCLFARHCMDVYTMNNALWLCYTYSLGTWLNLHENICSVLCYVFTRHRCGCTQREQCSLVCVMCSLNTCRDVYTTNSALWFITHVFSTHIFQCVQHKQCELASVTCVHLIFSTLQLH